MSADGCLGAADYAACRTQFNGVFRHGVHVALLYYADQLMEAVAVRRATLSDPTAAQVRAIHPLQCHARAPHCRTSERRHW